LYRYTEVALGGLPDPVPVHLRASVVHDWELDDMEEGYVADRAAYEADLRRATSQVKFLERLRNEDGGDAAAAAGGGGGGAASGDGGGTGGRGGATGGGVGGGVVEEATVGVKAAAASKAAAFECPVCHEEVDRSAAAAELAVLPCGRIGTFHHVLLR
jgi:E3 ubiquitin-protein ligase SHPRH